MYHVTTGQFYVMMSPQEVLQGQRNIAPRTGFTTPKVEGARSGRDDRRRATHNEGNTHLCAFTKELLRQGGFCGSYGRSAKCSVSFELFI